MIKNPFFVGKIHTACNLDVMVGVLCVLVGVLDVGTGMVYFLHLVVDTLQKEKRILFKKNSQFSLKRQPTFAFSVLKSKPA